MLTWYDTLRAEQLRRYSTELPERAALLEQLEAVYLFGTFDIEAAMRRDGSVLVSVLVDWMAPVLETGPWRPATEVERTLSLGAAAKKWPELHELIPQRPISAVDCSFCNGVGSIDGALCGSCGALGWRSATTA